MCNNTLIVVVSPKMIDPSMKDTMLFLLSFPRRSGWSFQHQWTLEYHTHTDDFEIFATRRYDTETQANIYIQSNRFGPNQRYRCANNAAFSTHPTGGGHKDHHFSGCRIHIY